MKFIKPDRTAKLSICMLLFIYYANAMAQSPSSIPLFVVKDHGKLGIIDSTGNRKIESIIDAIMIGEDDRAEETGLLYYSRMGVVKVRAKGKWGLIFHNGLQTPLIYDNVVEDKRGRYVNVSVNGKWGCYSKLGNLIGAPAEYDTIIQVFLSEYFKVKKGNLYGLVAENGRKVVDPLYEEFAYLSPSFIAVKLNDKWGIIDTAGELKSPVRFERLDMFSSSLFKFIEGNKWGLTGQSGKVIVPAQFDYKELNPLYNNSYRFKNYHDGEKLFVIQIDGKSGLIDHTGKVIVEPNYQQTIPFHDSLWWGGDKGLFGLYNRTQMLLAPQFDNININWQDRDFNHFVIVGRSGKSGLVDGNGKLIIEPQFDELSVQDMGILLFRIDKKYGLCDTFGSVLLKAEYDKIEYHYQNHWRLEKDGKVGLADSLGRILVYPEHQDVRYIGGNQYTFMENNKSGLLDRQGKVLIKANYDGIYGNGENVLATNWDFSFKDVLNLEAKPVITQVHEEAGLFGISTREAYVPQLRQRGYIGCGPGPVMPYMKGNILLKRKGRWGIADSKGNIVLKPKYDSILYYYFENLTAYSSKGKWGVINKQGDVISKPIYQEIILGDMKGYSRVRKNNKWGYLDNVGNLMIEPVYDKAERFNFGLAHVMLNGKSLLIDQRGKVIWTEN
jgi:hypothetical protein